MTYVKLWFSAIEQDCLSKSFVAASSRAVVFAELLKSFSLVVEVPGFDSMVITADEL